MAQRKFKDSVVIWILLILPIVSSILSTIHVISLTSLSNPMAMAIATAITFEIASLVSFLLSSGTILEKVSKGWVFFIFILLFLLQAFGNIYAGFSNITDKLVVDENYLSTFMEMCFNIFTITEAKWVISAAVGLPLPLISLIMIKFALDATDDDEIEKIKEEVEGKNEILTTDPYYTHIKSEKEDITSYPKETFEQKQYSPDVKKEEIKKSVKQASQIVEDVKKK